MEKIIIKKSSTADTRTCDVSKVSKEILLMSSEQHIGDVVKGMNFFICLMEIARRDHDFTKITHIDEFYKDFRNKFITQDWYDMHKRVERHHISVSEGVRDDINLVDVFEYIVDCVMAGMGRSGKVQDLTISNETLQKAFQNTINLLTNNVVVEPDER